VVKGVAQAVDCMQKRCADELLRNPGSRRHLIMHAEMLLGDSRFLLVDEFPAAWSPSSLGGSS